MRQKSVLRFHKRRNDARTPSQMAAALRHSGREHKAKFLDQAVELLSPQGGYPRLGHHAAAPRLGAGSGSAQNLPPQNPAAGVEADLVHGVPALRHAPRALAGRTTMRISSSATGRMCGSTSATNAMTTRRRYADQRAVQRPLGPVLNHFLPTQSLGKSLGG